MYSEVYEPKESNLTITIPDEFIGKRVVVEIKNSEEAKIDRIKKLEQSLVGYQVDLSNFKFNRDLANDYE
ncbi:MAG: hypothetical protein EAY66_04675 [Sphingobacteriales bacterium]|nr:MAG: hypothetical protein EAY66_04675 [Sphingobacteriales bacterium]